MKKLILIAFTFSVLVSCTKNFVTENQNPYQITDELLKQDFNLVGSPFSGMLFNLYGHQIEEDLCYDSWMGYMNTGTPFVSNVNNTTYYIRWNSYWDRVYGSVMSPAKQVIQLAKTNNLPLFADWAKLVKIMAISRLTAIHGPVIYSQYGSTAANVLYDKESDLYNSFFATLDTIQTNFKANKSYTGFAKFDPSYKGNMGAWLKLTNSLRLRLAMRISKVAPALAKTQGEKALNDPDGLILTNSDNLKISQLGNILPIAVICFQWDDTRMGAVIGSFLQGLKDGRISKYFQAPNVAADPSLSVYPYLGIRNGAYINAKSDHINFSKISNDFNTAQDRRSFTAAETAFLMAEAALRGWTGAGDAKTNYENGIRLSFADWGASGVDAYLADNTSVPVNYVDPKDSRNNFTTLSTVTVAWNNADNMELKLEKIITQKYIHNFTNALESWCDFRRTGYPKIPHVAKNDSSPDWGIVPANEWIKRMPFVNGERTGNAAGVTDATTKLGGKDEINTRLWWDVAGSNFLN